MDPVNVHIADVLGNVTGGGVIAFGAAVSRSAAGVVKSSVCTGTLYNLLGIAIDDMVEKDVDGFYALYDGIPVALSGRVRVWVTPNEHDTSIIAGDYLDLANLGSSNTLPVGVFEESGASAGQTRAVTSVMKAVEDVILTSALKYVVTVDSVLVGDTEITLDTAKAALFTVGDYILLEDLDGAVMINRVTAINGAVLTLALASTVALTGTTDYIHILTQVEAVFV